MIPKIDRNKCIACYQCVDNCVQSAMGISFKDDKPYINKKLCNGCGECIDICPIKCIKVRNNG